VSEVLVLVVVEGVVTVAVVVTFGVAGAVSHRGGRPRGCQQQE